MDFIQTKKLKLVSLCQLENLEENLNYKVNTTVFENVKSILDKTDISTKKRDEYVDSLDINIQ